MKRWRSRRCRNCLSVSHIVIFNVRSVCYFHLIPADLYSCWRVCRWVWLWPSVLWCLCMVRLWQYIRLMLMRRWSLILFGRTQSFGGGVLDQSSEASNSFVIINFINIHTVTDSTQHDIIRPHWGHAVPWHALLHCQPTGHYNQTRSCHTGCWGFSYVRKKIPSVLVWDRTEDWSVTKTKARQVRF